MLDGEDDLDLAPHPLAAPPQRGYTNYETPSDAPTGAAPAFAATGTPPHDEHARVMNTLTTTRSDEIEVDLGRIVDDVMGPPTYSTVEAERHHHFSAQSVEPATYADWTYPPFSGHFDGLL